MKQSKRPREKRKVLRVYVNTQELAAIERQANRYGLPISPYLRTLALGKDLGLPVSALAELRAKAAAL